MVLQWDYLMDLMQQKKLIWHLRLIQMRYYVVAVVAVFPVLALNLIHKLE
jgi:hypothetical protein